MGSPVLIVFRLFDLLAPSGQFACPEVGSLRSFLAWCYGRRGWMPGELSSSSSRPSSPVCCWQVMGLMTMREYTTLLRNWQRVCSLPLPNRLLAFLLPGKRAWVLAIGVAGPGQRRV